MPLHAGILAALVCLAASLAARAESTLASSQTGLRMADGLVWLEVHVAGRAKPLHFVLDTGAGVSVINSETARELDLQPGRKLTVRGTQGDAPARWMTGFTAAVANVTLPEKLLALDLSEISGLCDRRIDGLLGVDFLNDHKVQLDFASGVMRLDAGCAAVGSDAVAVPVARRNDAWCAVASVNNGEPCWLRIDSGFDGALNWWPGTSAERSAARPSTIALNVGARGTETTTVRIESLALDAVETKILPRPLFAREAGLIGLRVLAQYRLTFEVKARRLFVEPASK